MFWYVVHIILASCHWHYLKNKKWTYSFYTCAGQSYLFTYFPIFIPTLAKHSRTISSFCEHFYWKIASDKIPCWQFCKFSIYCCTSQKRNNILCLLIVKLLQFALFIQRQNIFFIQWFTGNLFFWSVALYFVMWRPIHAQYFCDSLLLPLVL